MYVDRYVRTGWNRECRVRRGVYRVGVRVRIREHRQRKEGNGSLGASNNLAGTTEAELSAMEAVSRSFEATAMFGT